MIPIETQIFRLIFPPAGAVPLEKLEAVPHIRQHINAIINLASTEHGISSPNESAALTARVIELRDTPGPDGKVRTWRTIAEICGTTLDAVRHRYGKGKATIRKSRTVGGAALSGYDITDKLAEFIEGPTAEVDRPRGALTEPHDHTQAFNERVVIGHVEPFLSDIVVSHHPKTETEPLQEAEPVDLEKPAEQEKKPDEVPFPLIFGSTWEEVDRMLGEGMAVKEISAELEKNGRPVPWTKIRARAAYLAKMKRKEAKPESQEVGATDARPEPVAISRKELDLRIWDMWRAGKTLDEISDILYSEGLYYSAKSVRVRLLSQGAKL